MQWVKVEDKPTVKSEYLIRCIGNDDNKIFHEVAFWDNESFACAMDDLSPYFTITHWQPLPAAPSGQGVEKQEKK